MEVTKTCFLTLAFLKMTRLEGVAVGGGGAILEIGLGLGSGLELIRRFLKLKRVANRGRDKTRHGKITQDKPRQDKTRQDKTTHSKTAQDMIKQDK